MSVKFIKNIVRIKKKNENEFKQIGAFGFKDEDAEAIRSDLEELETEVDGKASAESVQNLNASKLSKPTSGIEVGKYFRVASIDSEGNPVLEACDLPTASIVKSGMTSATDPEWTDAEKLSARQRMGLDKEWVLKGELTVGVEGTEDATSVNLDMTGCAEIALLGNVRATGNSNLTAVYSEFGSLSFANAFCGNGDRSIWIECVDSLFGVIPTVSKYAGSFNSKLFSATLAVYASYDVIISNMTSLKISTPSVVTFCDIKIYAR